MVTKRTSILSPQEHLAKRIQESCVVSKVKSHIAKNRRSKLSSQAPYQARAQATIDQILITATKLLTREGYNSFNTNRIASEAGISVATLYQYFDDKTAIISALVEGQSVRLIAALERSVSEFAHMQVHEAIVEIIFVMFATYRDETLLFGLIRNQVPYGEHAELTEGALQRIVDVVIFALRTRAREITLPDYQTVAFMIVHAVDGVIRAALNQNLNDGEYKQLSKASAGMILALLQSQSSEV
jgi:AcrR family transcriptional regulator